MRRLILAIVGLALSYQLMAVSLGVAKETDADVPLGGVSASLQPDLFTGTLTGSIPIDVPPGRNGMQPSLALTYASSGGNGWVGNGWKLEMGTIERQTRWGVLYSPTAQEELEGKVYTIRLNGVATDLVQAAPPAPSDEYRAKIEGGFLRIKKLSSDGTAGWEITDIKGTKYKFGTVAATRIVSGSMIFKWCLERVEDRDGNYMTITYQGDGTTNQGYMSLINYAGNGATSPTNQVKFYLEDRTDKPVMYTSNFPISTEKRLKTIEVKANGNLVRGYSLAYNTEAERSNLMLIQHFGKDAIVTTSGVVSGAMVAPAHILGYTATGDNFLTLQQWSGPRDVNEQSEDRVYIADFNGDGKVDVLKYAESDGWGFAQRSWLVMLSTGTGFAAPQQWSGPRDVNEQSGDRVYIADFDGAALPTYPLAANLLAGGLSTAPAVVFPTALSKIGSSIGSTTR